MSWYIISSMFTIKIPNLMPGNTFFGFCPVSNYMEEFFLGGEK
jgi:hypothetical protein